MNQDTMLAHLQRMKIPTAGIDYVITAATTDPAKTVFHTNASAIAGEHCSTIPTVLSDEPMHWRLQFSALSTEYAFVMHLESRAKALLVLDQPTSVPLQITNKAGRRQRITYTPDFLVVEPDRVRVVELKTKADAEKLVSDRPSVWERVEHGFRYIQAHKHFGDMGLEHEIVVNEQLPWLRIHNHHLLRTAERNDPGVLTDEVRDELVRYVSKHQPCSITQIISDISLTTATPILRAIHVGALVVDLDHVKLADRDSRFICIDDDTAIAVAAGLSSVQSIARTDQTISFDDVTDPRHSPEFGYRIATLAGNELNRPGEKKPPSSRTLRRWRATMRNSGQNGLRPRWHRCGKTGPRIEPWHMEIITKQLAKDRGSKTRPTRTASHLRYKEAFAEECRQGGREGAPISYGHYCKLWGLRKHNTQDAYGRGGKRLSNAAAPYTDVDAQSSLANTPFQVCSIDHCMAPALTSDPDGGNDGLPWLSILIDHHGREPLAMVMRFEPPSFESDALVLRDCVERHGRLPAALYTDGGPDFTSSKLAQCLAELGMSWFKRPGSTPRASAEVERPFLTFAQSVCQGREGYVPDIVNRRSVSREWLPQNGSRRSFRDLRDHSEHLLMDVLPNLPTLDGSPTARERREEFESTYGRQGIQMDRDLALLVATAVPIETKGKTEPAGAIRCGSKRFYSTALYNVTESCSRLSIRQDPQDRTVLYFALRGSWHVAKSRDSLHNIGTENSVLSDQSSGRPGDDVHVVRQQMLHSDPPKKEAGDVNQDSSPPESVVSCEAPLSPTNPHSIAAIPSMRSAMNKDSDQL